MSRAANTGQLEGYENEDRAQALAGNVPTEGPSGSMIFTAAGGGFVELGDSVSVA